MTTTCEHGFGGDWRVEYLVDGQNRRVGKRVNGILVKHLLWADQLRIAAELDGAGNLVSRFVYGVKPTTPELVIRGSAVYRVISDHLGSARLLVNINDPSDLPVRLDYEAFGSVSGTGGGVIPQGFAGGLYDAETGLVRFGARDYDPSVGRWVTKDPIRFAGDGANLYVYARLDPANFVDPTGREGFLAAFSGGFGAIANGSRTYGILDIGAPCSRVFKQDSFNVGPGGSTGVSGQLGYYAGSPEEFADATTVHLGLRNVSFNTFWNDGQFGGATLELGFGYDLGLLWSTETQTDIALCGCPIPL